MKFRSRHAILSILIAAVLGGIVVAEASAQSSRSSGSSGKAEGMYPQASRQEPEDKGPSQAGEKLQKLIDVYGTEDYAKVRAMADGIVATEDANGYERSLAAQLAAHAAYTLDDTAATKNYFQQVLQFNGLDNNGHFQSMLMLAQLQLVDGEYEPGLATLERYLTESKSARPSELALKGQALYQAGRYQEAIPPLKQALASTREPKDLWMQVLMLAYSNANLYSEAIALAEQLATKDPADRKAQANLAKIYTHAGRKDMAAAVLGTSKYYIYVHTYLPYYAHSHPSGNTRYVSSGPAPVNNPHYLDRSSSLWSDEDTEEALQKRFKRALSRHGVSLDGVHITSSRKTYESDQAADAGRLSWIRETEEGGDEVVVISW